MFYSPPPPLPTRNIFWAFPDAIDGGCSSLGTFQAHWRGVSLRRRLAAALAAVTWPDLEEEEEELLEELDTDGFTFDEVCARTSSRVLCKQHFDILHTTPALLQG